METVITKEIREGDLVGTLGCPQGDGPFQGVLALGGSDGGIPEYFLKLLVPEGFACLALAYFHAPGTSSALIEVPLERIQRGLRWMRSHPNVALRQDRVAVIGTSKGGELALLAAAHFPDDIGAVIAYTPSSVVWPGIDFSQPDGPMRSSWSLAGKPLPFVPYPPDVSPSMSDRGMSVLPIYESGLENGPALAEAAIPIERATGPVVVISGGDDRMWPAQRMCEMVVDRARRAGRKTLVRHLHFPEAGHVLFPYKAPSSGTMPPMPFDLGGNEASTASAHRASWPDVIRCLRQQDAAGAGE